MAKPANMTEGQLQEYLGYVRGSGTIPVDKLGEYEDYVRGSTTHEVPTEESVGDTLKRYAGNGLSTLGKLGGALRAATTGPLTGEIIQHVLSKSGKPVYSKSDVLGALNPSNQDRFPTNSEMLAQAGVSNPRLSDARPSAFAEHGKGAHWYTPEKGGLLDLSLGGAVEAATDPAMYLGSGEAGAAATALKEASPVASALSKIGAPLKMATSPISMIAKGVEALPVVGEHANTFFNPLSAVARGVGKTIYGATLRPVEHEGEKFGKEGVVQTLRDAGVWQPYQTPITQGLEQKVQGATDALLAKRGQVFKEAADAGATVPMREALSPGYAEAQRLRSLGSPSANGIADEIEKQLDHTVQVSEGVPATPGRPAQYATHENPSGLLDEHGQPMMKSETVQVAPSVAGDPGVPAQPYTPERASDLKSFMTSTLPNAAYNPVLATPVGARGIRNAAGGLKSGIENAVEGATGKGADLKDLNKALGNLIGTKKGLTRVANKADRDLDHVFTGTGLDGVVGGGVYGATGNPAAALKAIATKHALGLLRLGTMPEGYALQSLGNTNLLDRINEQYQENQKRNPWQLTK